MRGCGSSTKKLDAERDLRPSRCAEVVRTVEAGKAGRGLPKAHTEREADGTASGGSALGSADEGGSSPTGPYRLRLSVPVSAGGGAVSQPQKSALAQCAGVDSNSPAATFARVFSPRRLACAKAAGTRPSAKTTDVASSNAMLFVTMI